MFEFGYPTDVDGAPRQAASLVDLTLAIPEIVASQTGDIMDAVVKTT